MRTHNDAQKPSYYQRVFTVVCGLGVAAVALFGAQLPTALPQVESDAKLKVIPIHSETSAVVFVWHTKLDRGVRYNDGGVDAQAVYKLPSVR